MLVVEIYSCYWILAEVGQASTNKNYTYGTWHERLKFLQGQAERFEINSGVGRIGQMSFKSMQDCSEYLWEWLYLNRIPLGESGIGQNSFTGWQDWSEFLWESFFGRFPSGACRIGQTTFGSGYIWIEFLWGYLELARIGLEMGKIDQNSFGNGQDCTDYLSV